MKTVKAVAPYTHPGLLNFKTPPYEALVKLGGQTAKAHYPWRSFHGAAYRWELPSCSLLKSKKVARLRFVQPVSIKFDTFPDYCFYEIIPFIWDCWPKYFELTCKWLQKHRVRTAIFTSSQTAERMRERFPKMNIMFCPEGINTVEYSEGKPLESRTNRLYEIGQGGRCFLKTHYANDYERLSELPVKGLLPTKQSYIYALCNAQVTIAFPRCDLMPEETGDIETLTQRYWEAMLTRSVIVGRAPKELIDLIGYNPVIDLDKKNPIGHIEHMLDHIRDYQPVVDRNRRVALEKGEWQVRMSEVAKWLTSCGYDCGITEQAI